MDDNKIDFERFIALAKDLKANWLHLSKGGDIPPSIFVERNGKIQAVVISTEGDRTNVMRAITLLRQGFKADAVTVILDKYGDMARQCKEENAREKGIIKDVLVCTRVDENCEVNMWLMPYNYSSNKNNFEWCEDEIGGMQNFDKNDKRFCGYILENLGQIMETPIHWDEIETEDGKTLQDVANELELSEEQQLYHSGRGCLRVLKERGYHVMDMQDLPSGYTQDNNDLPSKYNVFVDIFPEDIAMEIGKLIYNRHNEPTFKDELFSLLNKKKSIIETYIKKAFGQSVSIQELVDNMSIILIPKSSPTTKSRKVKVWSGDKSEYYGLGNYVSDVQVYFIKMPDGSLRSLSNAEERPDDEMIKASGGELIEAGKNPKIILDNPLEDGRKIFYGCQIFWEDATQETKKTGFHKFNKAKK